jgi:hypothetical protein
MSKRNCWWYYSIKKKKKKKKIVVGGIDVTCRKYKRIAAHLD